MGRAPEGWLVIGAFVRYYLKPSLVNWRRLRRVCMARLPAKTTTRPAQ